MPVLLKALSSTSVLLFAEVSCLDTACHLDSLHRSWSLVPSRAEQTAIWTLRWAKPRRRPRLADWSLCQLIPCITNSARGGYTIRARQRENPDICISESSCVGFVVFFFYTSISTWGLFVEVLAAVSRQGHKSAENCKETWQMRGATSSSLMHRLRQTASDCHVCPLNFCGRKSKLF